jgi:hypothetical protein
MPAFGMSCKRECADAGTFAKSGIAGRYRLSIIPDIGDTDTDTGSRKRVLKSGGSVRD